VNIYRSLSLLYGQARGYSRLAISRSVHKHAFLSRQQLLIEQQLALRACVSDALNRFPYYRQKVREHCGKVPEPASSEFDFSSLPIWTREDQKTLFVQQNEPPVPGAFRHKTGGSSGEPVQFWVTRESYEWRYAVSQRGYSWAGAEDGKTVFYVWGAPAIPLSKMKQFKLDLYHRLLGHRIFNSFKFTEIDKAECCRRINACKPVSVVGYAGNLVDLAAYIKAHPSALSQKIPTGVTAAEGLDASQVDLVESYLVDALHCSYGSREFMLIGMENGDGNGYYLSDDNLYVEVVDDAGIPCSAGETGRILVTDMRNKATPFIRYEIGDLGVMAPQEDARTTLPFRRLASVSGRIREVIRLPGGENLTALFVPHLMKDIDWVTGYQIQQQNVDGMVIHIRCEQDPSSDQEKALIDAFRPYVGKTFAVSLQRVHSLERKQNGKTPIVVWKG